jgi:2-polyprenyl-3-methyl-5-hydroxy-6-metoxy-1,4-benzoquinol methylase
MDKNMKLEKLAKLYNTDKLEHGYIPYYEQHLPKRVDKLLEIGCFRGASLRMWQTHFKDAEIHTIDIFNPNLMTAEAAKAEGFIAHKGDQGDTRFLDQIKDQYDIIIDDGSHNADHQQITFAKMFVDNLKSGGLYIIEDLHCCKEPFYWGTAVSKIEDTALGFFQNYEKTKHLENAFIKGDVSQLISDTKMYMEKIVFVWKK